MKYDERCARYPELFALALLASWLSSGCSIILDADRTQCADNRPCPLGHECVSGVCLEADRFECAGTMAPTGGQTVEATLEIGDFVTDGELPFEVEVCPSGDPQCTMPGPRIRGVLNEATGFHDAQVTISSDPQRAVSTLQIYPDSPNHAPILINGHQAFGHPAFFDGPEVIMRLVDDDTLMIFHQLVGSTPREDYASLVLLDTEVCITELDLRIQEGAEGLRVVWPAELVEPGVTTVWYMNGGVPSAGVDMTDGSGIAGLMNARPGSGMVEVRERGNGDRLLFRTPVTARVGFNTYWIVLPEVFPTM